MSDYTRPAPKPMRKKREFKRPAVKELEPLEDTEQLTVVDWLRTHRIRFHASPNGGYRHPVTAMRMKRMGCSPGFPDIVLFDRPLIIENGMVYVGCAIEMKRRKSGTVSPEQKDWLAALKELGWATRVCRGCDDAIEYLKSLGYGTW